MAKLVGFLFAILAAPVLSLKYDPREESYNLNTNKEAQHPLDYTGQWENHTYHPSPDNWRFPFYTLLLDRYVNGDPSNDNANGTIFEQDVLETQFRHGGDLAGLVDTLDYIQGIGIKAIYVAGTPFINAPWEYDSYSPRDFTLLDRHFGDINEWRAAVDEIHKRGMYLVLDNTMSTMGDLIGFENYLNATTTFSAKEHEAVYKTNTTYNDFTFGNNYNASCEYPRFWNSSGQRVLQDSDPVFSQLIGCYDSEFDQYGDTEAFGNFPDWQRQLSKFASIQDRLREWVPSVRSKIELFACLTISMLDIDGFRFDKATQITVDALADFGDNVRACARSLGKENFFMTGEITGGNTFGSIYLGRGREPEQRPTNITAALLLTNSSTDVFLRDSGKNALDSAAFHYSVYRHLTRLLGMDGNLTEPYDTPDDFLDTWNTFLTTNDLVNPNTNKFDPRHMFGVTNQDVFRWPAIKNGTQKMLLGSFITTLELPGIPLLLWGEEQAFYVLDSTASNYIFGRSPMSSAIAWQNHGCYKLGSNQYYNFPVDAAANGCHDDQVSLDHRNPSHPVHNIIKSMYRLRREYPVLNDGYFLQQLSNNTHFTFLPGSNGTATEIGVWSVVRDQYPGVQNLTGTTSVQPVWLVYQNDGQTVDYQFDCTSNDTALISPFAENTTVKNLLAPYDELTLKRGPKQLFLGGSQDFNGCLDNLRLDAFAFKAYVPKENWVSPAPVITKFLPGHDARLLASPDGNNTVDIVFQFSDEMDCDSISRNLVITSTTDGQSVASIDPGSIVCGQENDPDPRLYVAQVESTWAWNAKLVNVQNGVHVLTIQNASLVDGSMATDSVDHFMFRIGNADNPVVFPRTGNYSSEVLTKDAAGTLHVSHRASGADKWRYSTNWGSSWSPWTDYTGGSSAIVKQSWSGTKRQEWSGEHVILQYWSRATGSSSHIQHGDAEKQATPRRFPHIFAHGPFNQFGFDAGLANAFQLQDGLWKFHLMTEWPAQVQINVWGINPDGQPDQSFVYGDVDNDTVLDRSTPGFLGENMVNLTQLPRSPFLAYRVELDDATMKFNLVPAGSRIVQIIVFALMWLIPILTGVISIWTYMGAFYRVKFNASGIVHKTKMVLPFSFRRKFEKLDVHEKGHMLYPKQRSEIRVASTMAVPTIILNSTRRTVLIATMEYDIEDWGIKIKIGGLGVMAQLMGKSLTDQDLIWVVPCVGGIDYPIDRPAEPMIVTILGVPYTIEVQYHTMNNITYVLLDAPIFRQQSKSEPYPPRMDDLDSAVYYSAWNACIAQACTRFPVDIYHINDYHGAAAPLYLLPKTIPCCLSLHNAEFQGLWPMRTPHEREEVCKVYNLDKSIVERYVQFGEVFNLLHAGASYLRIHQKGFGAVGVSNKYGVRSYARYPIFWGLKEIGKLPNPDPSDTDPWDREAEARQVITVDPVYEASRGDLRRQAQEWAQLDVNPNAELFVFVGRWSNQKGLDLIADCFPAILEKHPNVQLICIGPVIDLYGKFAALKLDVMMKKYPRRVYSKPVFTALPPFIFTGAEFALIPSRDEPFGLVAVEFGRKGALGVGARVGGLGQMPGWWYTVESTTTKHLQKQFKLAIEEALTSKPEERAMMRAKSAKQRFPVARWVEDLNILESTSIRIHNEEASGHRRFRSSSASRLSNSITPASDGLSLYDDASAQAEAFAASGQRDTSSAGLSRSLSLGVRNGPGHRTRLTGQQVGESVHEMDEDERDSANEYRLTPEQAEEIIREEERGRVLLNMGESGPAGLSLREPDEAYSDSRGRGRGRSLSPLPSNLRYSRSPDDRDRSESPSSSDSLLRQGRSLSTLPSNLRYSRSPDDRGRSESPSSGDRLLRQGRSLSPLPSNLRYSRSPYDIDRSESPSSGDSILRRGSRRHRRLESPSHSVLDLTEIKRGKTDFSLQMVDPTFNDTTGEYFKAFDKMLQSLDAKNSEKELCIEEYLMESEKAWFKRLREAKLNRSRGSSPLGSPNPSESSLGSHRRIRSRQSSPGPSERYSSDDGSTMDAASLADDEFLLGKDYQRPSAPKRLMQRRIGDWPIYSLILALGQIIAANSYQITLLTGGQSQTPEKLYIIGGIYMAMTCVWWVLYRRFKSLYVLSIPFAIYGLAFVFLGMAPFLGLEGGRHWMQNVATGLYTAASASGSIFFALNFGDEGGAPIKAWVFRACVIQGTQQLYITALFYWGATQTVATATGKTEINPLTDSKRMAFVTLPIAGFLWAVGLVLFTSLPPYYRHSPGKISEFYRTLLSRKLILWFFITVVLQNYFLSSPYGRNWQYLWSSTYAPQWTIGLLVLTFFVFIWAAFLFLFGRLSKKHSWILPIFAIGLGAPRWAQMLWGTSGIGLWVPWMPGGPIAGALAGRSLWLWLGLLDSIQGVGFGMILLQTLTRIHIAVTLMMAQFLGTAITLIAKATAPDRNGPGDVFPDFSAGVVQGIAKPWFWIALACQLIIPIGFFKFFRKEQLSKP